MNSKQDNRKVVIELDNVKRYFQVGSETVKALRGISFKIYEGEFVTIMGTSGSGKSTLLNIIAGFDKPTKGDILGPGDKQTYTVRIEYDSEADELPDEDITIKVEEEIDYGQEVDYEITVKNIGKTNLIQEERDVFSVNVQDYIPEWTL